MISSSTLDEDQAHSSKSAARYDWDGENASGNSTSIPFLTDRDGNLVEIEDENSFSPSSCGEMARFNTRQISQWPVGLAFAFAGVVSSTSEGSEVRIVTEQLESVRTGGRGRLGW